MWTFFVNLSRSVFKVKPGNGSHFQLECQEDSILFFLSGKNHSGFFARNCDNRALFDILNFFVNFHLVEGSYLLNWPKIYNNVKWRLESFTYFFGRDGNVFNLFLSGINFELGKYWLFEFLRTLSRVSREPGLNGNLIRLSNNKDNPMYGTQYLVVVGTFHGFSPKNLKSTMLITFRKLRLMSNPWSTEVTENRFFWCIFSRKLKTKLCLG